MDPQQQHLFSLMAVVQESQQAMESAVAGLAAERAALAQERAALAHDRQAVTHAAAQLASIQDSIRKSAGEAVGALVDQAVQGAAVAAARALGQATQPVVDGLSEAAQAARHAEGAIRQAGAWFAWKWVALAGAGTAGVCLVTLMAVWGLRDQVQDLRLERDELQATVDVLERKGGRLVLNDCGGRRCVEINPNQGAKKGAEWRGTKGERYVIPTGY